LQQPSPLDDLGRRDALVVITQQGATNWMYFASSCSPLDDLGRQDALLRVKVRARLVCKVGGEGRVRLKADWKQAK